LAARVATFWTGGKPLQCLKRRLHDLPPVETTANSCRPFKRRFEASFEEVSNDYLFSKNHKKVLKNCF
jgi:hypothetical protein